MDAKLLHLGFEPVPLSGAQQRQLDATGFAILEDLIAPRWLLQLRQAFDAIFAKEGAAAGAEVAQMEGVRRLAALVNTGAVFAPD